MYIMYIYIYIVMYEYFICHHDLHIMYIGILDGISTQNHPTLRLQFADHSLHVLAVDPNGCPWVPHSDGYAPFVVLFLGGFHKWE